MKLGDITIREAIEGLRTKNWRPSDLTEAALETIKATESQLNAFITVDAENARSRAHELDAALESDPEIIDRQPLFGIPIGLKDIYSTKGLKTTAGSKVIPDYIPPYDATATKRLKDAGAVIIGKANLDAWAHGSSGENSEYGPTKNPYNLAYVPGGSSSGSAAMVAAGDVLMAGGTDTGGSIRLPASFTNTVGIKPTYGRVSRYGIIAMASSLDTIGHFTKSVYDNALIMEVTAGRDPYDATSADVEVLQYTKELSKPVKGMKIGIPREYFTDGVDKKVMERMQEVITILKKQGATFEEMDLPNTENAIACYYILCPAEISSNLARFDGVRYGQMREMFGPEAKRRIMLGTHTLSAGYADDFYKKGNQIRSMIQHNYQQALSKYDAIITPVSPTPPFKLGERSNDPVQMYMSDLMTVAINIAGVPAISVPAGFVNDLPVGVQFIAANFREDILYRVGHAIEQETGYYRVRPQFVS